MYGCIFELFSIIKNHRREMTIQHNWAKETTVQQESTMHKRKKVNLAWACVNRMQQLWSTVTMREGIINHHMSKIEAKQDSIQKWSVKADSVFVQWSVCFPLRPSASQLVLCDWSFACSSTLLSLFHTVIELITVHLSLHSSIFHDHFSQLPCMVVYTPALCWWKKNTGSRSNTKGCNW